MLLGTTPQERRLFKRIQLKLVAEVTVKGSRKEERKQNVRLLDISGGGVRFASRNAEIFHIGQLVHISIHLPGKSEVSAFMKGWGKVVRIQTATATGAPPLRRKEIAITLDAPLKFVRSA